MELQDGNSAPKGSTKYSDSDVLYYNKLSSELPDLKIAPVTTPDEIDDNNFSFLQYKKVKSIFPDMPDVASPTDITPEYMAAAIKANDNSNFNNLFDRVKDDPYVVKQGYKPKKWNDTVSEDEKYTLEHKFAYNTKQEFTKLGEAVGIKYTDVSPDKVNPNDVLSTINYDAINKIADAVNIQNKTEKFKKYNEFAKALNVAPINSPEELNDNSFNYLEYKYLSNTFPDMPKVVSAENMTIDDLGRIEKAKKSARHNELLEPLKDNPDIKKAGYKLKKWDDSVSDDEIKILEEKFYEFTTNTYKERGSLVGIPYVELPASGSNKLEAINFDLIGRIDNVFNEDNKKQKLNEINKFNKKNGISPYKTWDEYVQDDGKRVDEYNLKQYNSYIAGINKYLPKDRKVKPVTSIQDYQFNAPLIQARAKESKEFEIKKNNDNFLNKVNATAKIQGIRKFTDVDDYQKNFEPEILKKINNAAKKNGTPQYKSLAEYNKSVSVKITKVSKAPDTDIEQLLKAGRASGIIPANISTKDATKLILENKDKFNPKLVALVLAAAKEANKVKEPVKPKYNKEILKKYGISENADMGRMSRPIEGTMLKSGLNTEKIAESMPDMAELLPNKKMAIKDKAGNFIQIEDSDLPDNIRNAPNTGIRLDYVQKLSDASNGIYSAKTQEEYDEITTTLNKVDDRLRKTSSSNYQWNEYTDKQVNDLVGYNLLDKTQTLQEKLRILDLYVSNSLKKFSTPDDEGKAYVPNYDTQEEKRKIDQFRVILEATINKDVVHKYAYAPIDEGKGIWSQIFDPNNFFHLPYKHYQELTNEFFRGLETIKYKDPYTYSRLKKQADNKEAIASNDLVKFTNLGAFISKQIQDNKLSNGEITDDQHKENIDKLKSILGVVADKNIDVLRRDIAMDISNYYGSKDNISGDNRRYMYTDEEIDTYREEMWGKFHEDNPHVSRKAYDKAFDEIKEYETIIPLLNGIPKSGGARPFFRELTNVFTSAANTIADISPRAIGGRSYTQVFNESRNQSIIDVGNQETYFENTKGTPLYYYSKATGGLGQLTGQILLTELAMAPLSAGVRVLGLAGKAGATAELGALTESQMAQLARRGITPEMMTRMGVSANKQTLIGSYIGLVNKYLGYDITREQMLSTFVTSGLISYDQHLKEAMRWTDNDATATGVASLMAVVEGISEMALPNVAMKNKFLLNLKSSGFTKFASKLTLDDIAKGTYKQGLKEIFGKVVKGLGRSTGILTTETLEELMVNATSFGIQDTLAPETIDSSLAETSLETVKATMLAMSIPALLGFGGALKSNRYTSLNLLATAQNPLGTIDVINKNLADGVITPQQHLQQHAIVRAAIKANKELYGVKDAQGNRLSATNKAVYVYSRTRQQILEKRLEKAKAEGSKSLEQIHQKQINDEIQIQKNALENKNDGQVVTTNADGTVTTTPINTIDGVGTYEFDNKLYVQDKDGNITFEDGTLPTTEEQEKVKKEGIFTPQNVNSKEAIDSRPNTELFPDETKNSMEVGGSNEKSKISSYREVNGIGITEYTNPTSGIVDVIMTGTSNNDFVGYVRVYENGKATERWTSKMENKSGNTKNFKTMISEAQRLLPAGHEYTEKTNISTDGLGVYAEQLNRGYEILTDESGNPVTEEVFINVSGNKVELSAVNNNEQDKKDFNVVDLGNTEAKRQQNFEKIKKQLAPLLSKLGLTENDVIRKTDDSGQITIESVAIRLPVLKSTNNGNNVTTQQTTEQNGKDNQKGDSTTLAEVERLRAEEQKELDEKIPNAEQYRVDGKVDRTKLTNDADRKAFDEVYAKYDKLITPLLEKTTPKTRNAFDSLPAGTRASEGTTTNKAHAPLFTAAKKALKVLTTLFPSVDIHFHDNNADFQKVLDLTARGKDARTTQGNFAYLKDGKTIRIDINLESGASIETVVHEALHGMLFKAFRNNQVLFNYFKNHIAKNVGFTKSAKLKKFIRNYSNIEQPEEYLVQLGAILNSGEKIEPTVLRRIAEAINKIVLKYTGGKFKPFEDVRKSNDTVRYFSSLVDAIRTGDLGDIKLDSQSQESESETGGSKQSRGGLTKADMKSMTVADNGDLLFFHYGDIKGSKVDARKGTPKPYTTDKRVYTANYYYTNESDREGMVGGKVNVVRVPADKVYNFNKDVLGLFDEAKKNSEAQSKGQAFSPNRQADFIAQLAARNGFDMMVAKWGNGYRAESPKALPIDAALTKQMRTNGSLSTAAVDDKLNQDIYNAAASKANGNSEKYRSAFYGIKDITAKDIMEHPILSRGIPKRLADKYNGGQIKSKQSRSSEDNLISSNVFVGRDNSVSLISDNYKEDNGLSTNTPNMTFAVSEEDGKRIADAYDKMQHAPNNPSVKKGFKELISQIKSQADILISKGYKFQIANEGEGYSSNSKKMIEDVRANKRIFIDPSSKSFGTDRTFDDKNIGLQDSGYKDANGIPMTNVELIRGVHDLFGHNEFGNGFNATGEENAWRNHMSMFTGLAQKALTATTRGQNSWVNFGKHMRNADGSIKKKGDEGYLSANERPFAEQKIGFLPNWATDNAYGEVVTIEGKSIKPINKYVVEGSEIFEIDDAKSFYTAMKSAKESDKLAGIQVELKPVEKIQEILDKGGRLLISKDGKVGMIVESNGNAGGGFKNTSAEGKNLLKPLLITSIKLGARYTDAYDTFLPEYYSKFGFKTYKRIKFNPEYAEAGWDNTILKSKPDIVVMYWDGGSRQNIEKNYGKFPAYNKSEGEYTTDYEGAISEARDMSIAKEPEASLIPSKSEVKSKQSVNAWQGSPHNFNKEILVSYPDGKTEYIVGTPEEFPEIPKSATVVKEFPNGRMRTDKMGTGEGMQAFGWGLYFADLKSIAENYAKKLSTELFYYDGKPISDAAYNYLFLAEDPFSDVDFDGKRIKELAPIAIDKIKNEYIPDFKDTQKTSFSQKQREEMPAKIKEAQDAIKELKDIIKSKEITSVVNKKLYEVTLHEGKTPEQYTFLEWDKPISNKTKQVILRNQEALKKSINESKYVTGKESVSERNEILKEVKDEIIKNLINSSDVKVFYGRLSSILGGGKQASLFLLENGIDGIKYPAESISRGATSDTARGFNYVVFDENAVTIKSKQSRTEDAKSAYEAKLEENLEQLRDAYGNARKVDTGVRKIAEDSPTSVGNFIKRLINGATPEAAAEAKAKLVEMQRKYRKEKAEMRAMLPRERGVNFVIEKISRAARNGDITQDEADLAIDLLRKSPSLFGDLAISITSGNKKANGDGVQGWYRAADELVKIFKNPKDPLTVTHELLHHTERFLPQEVRDGIIKEWHAQVQRQAADIASKLKTETDTDTRQQLTQALLYLGLAEARQLEPDFFNAMAMENIMKKYLADHTDSKGNFNKGLGDSWYQLYNPSEWWAVNASKIFSDAKNKPALKTWTDKAKAFYNYLIDSIKKVFKGNPIANVEKGLKAILEGNTLENIEGNMLANSKQSLNIKQKESFEERNQIFSKQSRTEDALKDVESTAKALENIGNKKLEKTGIDETPTARDVDYGGITWQQSGLSSFNKGSDGKTYITDKDGNVYSILKTKVSANDTFLVSVKDTNGKEVGNFEFKKNKDGSFSAQEAYVSETRKGLASIAYDFASQEGVIIKPSNKLKSDGIKFWSKSISEAYHKAKKDGSNPELVKAVEEAILGKVLYILNDTFNQQAKKTKIDKLDIKALAKKVVDIVKSSKLYEQTDDIERDNAIIDFLKSKGIVQKRVIEPRNKNIISVNEVTALKDQIRLEIKAANDGAKSIEDAIEKIGEIIKGLAKGKKISVTSAKALINKFSKMNTANKDSVNSVLDYASKIFNDAEYADKVSQVRALNAAMKRAAKNSAIPPATRSIALSFAKINPEAISDIDAHLEAANKIKDATLGVKENGVRIRKAIDINAMADYIKSAMAEQDTYDAKNPTTTRVVEPLDEEKALEYLTAEHDSLLQAAKAVAPSAVLTDAEMAQLKNFLKLSIDDFETMEEKIAAVEALEHFATNEDMGKIPFLLNNQQVNANIKKGVEVILPKLESVSLMWFSEQKAKIRGWVYNKFLYGNTIDYNKELAYFMNQSIRRIDNLIGNLKTYEVFNNTFKALASGYAKYIFKIKSMEANIIFQKVLASFYGDMEQAVKHCYKMTMYKLQLEYESNIGNKEVIPAIKHLNETLKSGNLTEKDKDELRKLIDEFSTIDATTGEQNIDTNKIWDSFSEVEQQAAVSLAKLYEKLRPYAQHVAVSLRGGVFNPRVNYMMLNVISTSQPLSTLPPSASQVLTGRGSTEAQTINPRDGYPHAISLDPYNTFNTANRDIMMDYCLLNPIKTVEAIFEKLVKDTAGNKKANDVAKSLQLIFNEITQSVINRSIVNSDKISDGIISYIKKVGAKYMLSRPTKATGEFASNLSYAITRYGENIIEGMKNNSLQRNFKLTTVMEVLNSYSLDRLYPHKGESGAFLDPNSFDIDVRDKKHFIDGFSNVAQVAYYNSLLKAQKAGESISDALMSVPDLSIGRFAWEGTFRLTFKKETGLDIDMDKIEAKDYDYLEKYKDELEKATTEADRVIVDIANTRNPFVGIAKEGAWRGKMSEILIINNYMTSFTKTENQNGIDAAYAVAYGGKTRRIDGIRTIAAILVRSGVYYFVKYKAQLALLAIGYGLLNAIKGGDDSEEKRRRRARGILKYNTVENPEIQGSITGIKDAITMGNAIQTYDSAWIKKANQYVAPEESASHSFMKGMAQAGAGIILGRSSGGFYNSLVTAPLVEYANEKYIHPAISSEPYNKYRDGIMYSKVYDPNRQDPELNFIVDNSGAFQPFMRASISAVRTFYDRYGSELAKVEKKIEDHERGVSMAREDATKDKYYELVKRRDALKEKEKSMKSMTLKNIIVGVGTATGILPAGKDIDFVGDKILKDESVPKDWNEIVEKFKESRNYDEGTMNRRNRNYKDMVLPEVYQQHVSQGYPIPAKKP